MSEAWTDTLNPFTHLDDQEPRTKTANGHDPVPLPVIWDAVDTLDEFIPPREWLLGNVFCKGFTSSLVGAGAAGKTAVRLVQALAIAVKRSLTEEYVHKRAKVLFLCFEDGERELKRRIKAALIHHKVTSEARGWLFCSTITGRKLFANGSANRSGPYPTELFDWLLTIIKDGGFELVILDPFIKIHASEENDNSAIEQVCAVLAHLAVELNIAVDVPHHVRKGPAEPGDADVGRGASAARDALRLGYTLTPMSRQMAEACGVKDEALRRSLVRMDSAKVNIAPPTVETIWFRLVGVSLGNGTEAYPNGDNVHTVERWHAPNMWKNLSHALINDMLDNLEKGVDDDGIA